VGVQFSTLVCEIPIFEIPLPLIDGNPTNIHVSSIVLAISNTLP